MFENKRYHSGSGKEQKGNGSEETSFHCERGTALLWNVLQLGEDLVVTLLAGRGGLEGGVPLKGKDLSGLFLEQEARVSEESAQKID